MVATLIEDNDENLISASDARTVLDAIIDSFYNLVSTPNPTAPSLENVLLEGNASGATDIFINTGRYLLFQGPGTGVMRIRPVQFTGPQPAYMDIVVQAKAGTLALLSDLVDSTWLRPVIAEVAEPTGSEVEGARYIVSTGAVNAFAGHATDIAEKVAGTWVFTATHNGDMVRSLSDTNGVIKSKEGGVWVTPVGLDAILSLETVLGIGNRTGANDLGIDGGQAIIFRSTDTEGQVKLVSDASDDATIEIRALGGTMALLSDVVAPDLHGVLVNGSDTDGRSITVSEFDGVNFEQGANMVRLKAPVSATALRTLLLPDKSGTLATTTEVDAVAALVDGTLKAPEAFVPTGTYPTTYGGVAVQRGDTFRLGAGTMGAATSNAEDLLVALVDLPGQTDANWQVLESNRTVATQAQAEDSATSNATLLMPPVRWWQAWAKGLTLAGFFAAVRGVVLTGYAAGANTAIAATDSILGAFAKVQGQLNATNTAVSGKLAKASNLSDLANVATAQSNLGLKALALQDYSQALIDEAVYLQPSHGLGVGELLGLSGVSWVRADGGDLSKAMVLGMVHSVVDANSFRVLRRGKFYHPSIFAALTAGARYYLSESILGGWTVAKPSEVSVPAFVALGSNTILFDPQPEQYTEQRALQVLDLPTTNDIVSGGLATSLTFSVVRFGVYELKVNGRVATMGPANFAVLGISAPPGSEVFGSFIRNWGFSGETDCYGFSDMAMVALSGGAMDIARAMPFVMDATVVATGAGSLTVMLATDNSSVTAKLMAGSRATLKRIA